jgi:hypothetical protein
MSSGLDRGAIADAGQVDRFDRMRSTCSAAHFLGGVQMIHALLVLAVILFVLWLLFHATGGLVNLIWLVIIVLVVLWLFGFVRGRSAR